MHWITIVIIGHFLNALSFVLDKVLLTKSIKNSFAFTFYIGLMGLAVAVLIPFGFFEIPATWLIWVNLAAGALFSAALLFFFLALQDAEASRIIPFVGGGIPVFTLVFEILFLEGNLTSSELLAFGVLVLGTIIITFDDKASAHKHKTSSRTWAFGILAALCFALSFVVTKVAFDHQPFLSSFIWSRFGAFLLPAFFLLSKNLRKEIVSAASIFKQKSGLAYLLAQGFGAVGFVFINWGISLASVSLVNAMQGVQYAFLLLMAILGSIKYPNLLKESMTKKGLVIKLIALGIIALGLYLIATVS